MDALTSQEADTLRDAINATSPPSPVSSQDMQDWASRQGTSGTLTDLQKLKLLAQEIAALGG